MIGSRRCRLALAIGLGDQALQAPLLNQVNGGTEGTEFLQMRHIDAVVVRIADLWRTRHHDDLLGMQTVENLKNALLERGASHDRIVDDHEVILIRLQ